VREIREETQLLAHQDLVLEFCGKSFSFSDEQAQRSWTVHPFGWILKVDESKIQIDWEHSGWKWFDPQKVLDGSMTDQCVPNIHKSLQRVYFGPEGIFKSSDRLINRSNPAGAAFLQTIQELKANTRDGARVLATEALQGLLRIAECFQIVPNEDQQQSSKYWHALRVAAYHLIYSGRPSMNAAISAAVLDALKVMAGHVKDSRLDLQAACDVLHRCIAERTSTSIKIAQAFTTFVAENTVQSDAESQTNHNGQSPSDQVLNIITISSSSTILAALKQLIKDQNDESTINLTIFESRPSCEGATLAASLITSMKDSVIKPRLNIKIAPESHISLLTTHNAIVLLGADRITSTGHTINKTGSTPLALVARTRGSKVVVLSEGDKIAKPRSDLLETYKRYIEKADNASLSEDDRQEMSECVRKEAGHGHVERHDANEVCDAWSEEARVTLLPYVNGEGKEGGATNVGVGVEVENVYFETVDQALIDHYISEEGEISKDRILRESVERARLEDELFGDLYD